MNMKKAIAGIFAGAVAMSAVATTMASAKTISYAAIDKTFSLGVNGYALKDFTETVRLSDGTDDYFTPTADIVAGNDEFTLNFSVPVKNVTVKINATSSQNDKTLKSDVDDDTAAQEFTFGGYSTVFENDVNYTVDVTYTYDLNDTIYKYKSEAQKAANSNEDVTFNITTESDAGTLYAELKTAYGQSNTWYFLEQDVQFEVTTAKDNYPELNEGVYYDVSDWNITSDDEKGEDVVDAVSEALEARTKAQVIFTFDGLDDWNDDDDITATVKFDTKEFGILKQTVDVDIDNQTATIDWNKIIKSASSTNTLGDISNKIDDISIRLDSEDEDAFEDVVLKSITVKGPAENYEELSAGESVADTTAAITTAATAATTTAAATTEATTTAAASNPKTGNAPVALAVIPVAIAAAAIIAKKRG